MKRIKTYLKIRYVLLLLAIIASCKKEKKKSPEQYYGEPIEVTREYFPMHGLFDFTSSPAVSPDGKYLVYRVAPSISVEKYGLWLVDLQNQTKDLFQKAASSPSWAPDSEKICYTVGGNIIIGSRTTKTTEQLTVNGRSYLPHWHPQKDIILYDTQVSGTYKIAVLDIISMNMMYQVNATNLGVNAGWLGETDSILTKIDNVCKTMDISTGEILSSIYLGQLTGASILGYPVISPNGKKIAFQSNNCLYIINVDGTGLQQLLYNRVDKKVGEAYKAGDKLIGDICWHPDGETLIYQQIEFKASVHSVLGLEGQGYSTLYKLNIAKALQTNKP